MFSTIGNKMSGNSEAVAFTPVDNSGETTDNSSSLRPRTNRNRNMRGQMRNMQVTTKNPVSHGCDTPAVGAVLALRLDKYDKKLPYEFFSTGSTCMRRQTSKTNEEDPD